MSQEQRWQSYEQVARELLDKIKYKFGLGNVEGKQIIEGHRSATKYEI